ncbi:hypothetical protein GCM10007036_15830 [Alsobacter metallidurans]|uniref:Uncharacterized protein n=1 Tax=Alsobacter metallidurans TaxID=340221 RepID=A0A917I561_9HYPH|nr:hypothetical protein [Alsobacter metallidurans]GGH15676.1 hypothetical protein GCM10007036_15830 [Alsobacter metallidurans]
MAAMWAILAVLGGGIGFTIGLNFGIAAAFVSAFVGAWTFTGAGVAALLLRGSRPGGEKDVNAEAADDVVEIDLDAMTDQMVSALRGALEAAERRDGAAVRMGDAAGRACA